MSKTALDAPRGNYFLMDPDDLVVITDRSHPLFDPRALEPPDADLVASIRIHGVDKIIKAVKDGDRAIVVDGRRRTIAAREAKRLNVKEGGPAPRVKVDLHRGDERSAVARMVLGNFSPKEESLIAKARKAQTLFGLNYPEQEIGLLFGTSASTVRNWLALLETHGDVQKAVAAGTARLVDAVRVVAKLPRAEQPAALSKLEAEKPTRAARKATGTKAKRTVTPVARLRRLEAFLDERPGSLPTDITVVLSWLRGDLTDRFLASQFGGLAPMFEAKGKRKAAR